MIDLPRQRLRAGDPEDRRQHDQQHVLVLMPEIPHAGVLMQRETSENRRIALGDGRPANAAPQEVLSWSTPQLRALPSLSCSSPPSHSSRQLWPEKEARTVARPEARPA